MAGKFFELRAAMPAADQQRALVKFTEMTVEKPYQALRRARGLSQKMLADVLHVGQPAIANMERQTDTYLSTLRSHIEDMGGVLEIVAKFPEGSVKINHFQALDIAEPVAGTEVV